MGIQVTLPEPGEMMKNTLKLDFYDKSGEYVRTDDVDTWYEVVDFRVKYVDGAFQVEVDIVRIDDEAEKLDEAVVTTVYREEWFTI